MSAEFTYLGTSIASLVSALSSSDPIQRRLGAYGLGEIGPAASEAAADLPRPSRTRSGSSACGRRRPWPRWRRHTGSWSPSSSRSWAPSLPSSAASRRGISAAWARRSLGSTKPSSPFESWQATAIRASGRRPRWRWGCSRKGAPPPELKFLSREGRAASRPEGPDREQPSRNQRNCNALSRIHKRRGNACSGRNLALSVEPSLSAGNRACCDIASAATGLSYLSLRISRAGSQWISQAHRRPG